MDEEFEIRIYETDSGKQPYLQWEEGLALKDRGIVTARLARIRKGNFGDCKNIKGTKNIYEFRIDFGCGYRIYYGMEGKKVILLLCAGNKSSQKKDIKKAEMLWNNYLER